MKSGIQRFFAYARARHEITLRRALGLPRPWTKDSILDTYRFTCVFREQDKTTKWFRQNVRDPMRNAQSVLLATVVFRMLNRIEVGEAIFHAEYKNGGTAWDAFLESRDVRHLQRAIKRAIPDGPYVTGGYIITSPPGCPKLEGMMKVIKSFERGEEEWEGLGAGIIGTMNWDGEEGAAEYMLHNRGDVTLESCWRWLRRFKWFGDFHSYEIVTDLRHTRLLDMAPDINTWANPGPGANRGANRVYGRDKDTRNSKEKLNAEMHELLGHSLDSKLWPQRPVNEWPRWEMRDVEHTLCEFDKYERVRLGEGRPRGVYR